MSKFGRKPIDLSGVQIEVQNNIVSYKGKESQGLYEIPMEFDVIKAENSLTLKPKENISAKEKKDINMKWGLHRALLNNKISGANKLFEKKIIIDGLGFKVLLQGTKLIFALGFSHKIEYDLPKNIVVEIDKTGQNLTVKSFDKELLGLVCSEIRAFRPAEPYKGKGIRYANEVILRKEGKKK